VSQVTKIKNLLQEFSLPLIFGVVAGLVLANIDYPLYDRLINAPLINENVKFLGHLINLKFLINEFFMMFFFGIATKEITESVLPGGALNPPSKAINPLLGTLGGVLGPIVFFLLFAAIFLSEGIPDVPGAIMRSLTPGGISKDLFNQPEIVFRGWGIPTATDIALAWLAARVVFGKGHPAVNFLLLLAVADDAIGLGIIAVFYPNPDHPVAPIWLLLVALGMIVAYGLRKMNVKSWVPYIVLAGFTSWIGLLEAHLHPALALVPIVPFLPGPKQDLGFFVEPETHDHADGGDHGDHGHGDLSTLQVFEHQLKPFVDFGLFFFAFANAGVQFSSINGVTWVLTVALIGGKAFGVIGFSLLGLKLGFPFPTGMTKRHLFTAGIVAGLGLTVALFVAGEAYPAGDHLAGQLQGPAKMGAVFSVFAGLIAVVAGRLLDVKKIDEE
jgi:NhaA family Na+:H+ antiporter